jgi:acetyl-CoA C-acetyltransferase
MRDVSIIGVGQTPVGEHWELSLRHLAFSAIEAALRDAGNQTKIEALYIGNMLAGQLSHQEHLGALIADFSGMRGIEALRVEAADASGGAALRQGYLAVASGAVDAVMVLGVEKFTDVVGSRRTAALSTMMDADYEGAQGATPASLAALIMQRYMHEYGVDLSAFAGFSVNAHANGAQNPNAMYRNRLKPEGFTKAPAVAPPVSLFDAAPEGDGAAALILTTTDRAKDIVPHPVRIAGSAVATDTLSVHDRADLLTLSAAAVSAGKAYQQANIKPQDVNVFELHDAYTILSALALEASGFAAKGEGVHMANDQTISLKGTLPVSTFGGLKARGHAGGATGVYQIVELAMQLRGQAGDNQVLGARIGMAQNLGGIGGTAVTHILEAVE